MEYTGQTNSGLSRRSLSTGFSTLLFPQWQNIATRLACLKTANAYYYLIIAMHTVMNLNYGWEIFMFPPPKVMPHIQTTHLGVIQNIKCFHWWGFLCKLVNQVGTIQDFQHTYAIKHMGFNIACAWNSVKANTLHQAWRTLWPATRLAVGALN
jgi:hypothetical protein